VVVGGVGVACFEDCHNECDSGHYLQRAYHREDIGGGTEYAEVGTRCIVTIQ
jgi:hypothetical protein